MSKPSATKQNPISISEDLLTFLGEMFQQRVVNTFLESVHKTDNDKALSLLLTLCRKFSFSYEIDLFHLARYDHYSNCLNYYLSLSAKDAASLNVKFKQKLITKSELLSEAALYGAEKNVELLLRAKVNYAQGPSGQNSFAPSPDGQTPLHKAAYSSNLKVMELLIKNGKAHINSVDRNGYAALDYAMVFNQDTAKQLQKAGAKNKVKFKDGKTYLGTSEVTIQKPTITEEVISETEKAFHNARVDLAKCAVSAFRDPRAVEEVEDLMSKAIEGFKSVIDKFLNGSQDHIPYVLKSYTTLSNISKVYTNSSSLPPKYLDKVWDKFTDEQKAPYLCELALKEGKKCKEDKNVVEALEKFGTAMKILEARPTHIPKEIKCEAYYEASSAVKYFNHHTSLDYMFKAREYSTQSTYDTITCSIISHLIALGNFSQASKEVSALQQGSNTLKQLLTAYLSLQKKDLSPNELKNIGSLEKNGALKTRDEKLYYKLILGKSAAMGGNFKQAITCYKSLLENSIGEEETNILRVLSTYHEAGKTSEGLGFLSECKKKYKSIEHTTTPSLLYLDFVLHEANGDYKGASVVLSKLGLGQSSFNTQYLIAATKIRITTDAVANIESCKERLDSLEKIANGPAIASQFKTELLQWAKNIRVTLDKKNAPVIKGSEEPQIKDTEDAEVSLASLDWAMTEEESKELLHLDPKKIHEYFVSKKQALLKAKIETIGKATPISSWKVGNKTYSTDSGVSSIEGKTKFFAIVDSRVKIDVSLEELFNSALDKGEVSKTFRSNGIKFISHKVVELKIKEDDRLYTNNIYKNENGEYLIIFDKIGKHQDVLKACKNGFKVEAVEMGDYFVDQKDSKQEQTYSKEEQISGLDNNNNNVDDYSIDLSGDH